MKKNLMLAISGLALGGALAGGALAGCASAGSAASEPAAPRSPSASAPPTSAPPVSTPPSGASPTPAPTNSPPSAQRLTVHLGSAFNPGSLRLKVGQEFLVSVSPSVKASGLSCGPAPADSSLSVRCVGTSQYLYRAVRPGSAQISAEVRPNCQSGGVCPQWITMPRLSITVGPADHPN